jgi:hypothetical protein
VAVQLKALIRKRRERSEPSALGDGFVFRKVVGIVFAREAVLRKRDAICSSDAMKSLFLICIVRLEIVYKLYRFVESQRTHLLQLCMFINSCSTKKFSSFYRMKIK